MKIGSQEHRDTFCAHFTQTYIEYDPKTLPWPVLDATALTTTGKRLRTACGAGGTAKDGVIEVQGDHVERVMAWLIQAGHRVKRAGG